MNRQMKCFAECRTGSNTDLDLSRKGLFVFSLRSCQDYLHEGSVNFTQSLFILFKCFKLLCSSLHPVAAPALP